jgi:hypothetical protein
LAKIAVASPALMSPLHPVPAAPHPPESSRPARR